MTPLASLQTPAWDYRESYLRYVEEIEEAREQLIPFVLGFPADDFQALLDRFEACKAGAEVPNGFVPHETFWLVDEGQRVVAVSNLRYSLTDGLRKRGGHIGFGVRPSARRRGFGTMVLRETLKKAGELGIARALVTCEKSNLGSAAAILRNGGVLEAEEKLDDHHDLLQRYWVPTAG